MAYSSRDAAKCCCLRLSCSSRSRPSPKFDFVRPSCASAISRLILRNEKVRCECNPNNHSSRQSGPPVKGLHAHEQGLAGLALQGVAIRILIVEDIEAWHCIYTEVLRRLPNWEIVGIARDGLEAMEKSRELKPDVVLLDVGLGRVDRLEAARQISCASPASRLLLLGVAPPSQLAEIALSIGAYGYVSKRNVVRDLIPALQAVAEGKRFIGQPSS